MGISVLIQSTLRNDLTGRDGVSITKALRTIPTASIRTIDPAGSFLPGVGNLVEVQDDLNGPTVTLFGGSISEVERIRRRTSIATLETNCSCVGKADRLERRLAGYYEFTGKTGGYILGQLVANSLSGDISIASPSGIATGPIPLAICLHGCGHAGQRFAESAWCGHSPANPGSAPSCAVGRG